MANLTFDFLHNYVTGERRESDPADAYQFDEGHVLEAVVPVAVTSCEIQYWIRGMEKADAYTPTSITKNTDNTYTILGNIPNSYFETNGDLRVYIVVTDGNASVTTYEGYIHIKERQMPEDYVDDDPDNEAVRVITEAQAAATTATQQAQAASTSAGQAQQSAQTLSQSVAQIATNTQNIAQLQTDTNTLKEDFHSYHSELGSGYADQIVSSIENTDQTPYNFRAVPYDATLEQVEGIVGVDVVLNQLVKELNRTNWINSNPSSAVTFEDGVATLNAGTNFGGMRTTYNLSVLSGHKYFMSVDVKATTAFSAGKLSVNTDSGKLSSISIVPTNTSNFVTFTGIVIANGDETSKLYMWDTRSTGFDNVYVKNFMLFDLTQTFGSQIADYAYSLEQSTAGAGVAWLKEHFSKIFDAGYIAYNAGTMVHVSGLSAKKTVGFNQWDEEWEVGLISVSNGQNVTGQGIRSKNMCKCFPNTQYHTKFNSDGSKYIFWYDVDGNFIYQNPVGSEQTFTSPDNARYFKIRVDTIINYNHDICINLSDPARNGTYEPYTEHTYPLDSSVELRGMPKLKDGKMYFDGDRYLPDGTVQRRYGIVDLGTLDWSFVSTSEWNCFSAQISGKANSTKNFMCAKYVNGTIYGTDTDKIINGNASNANIYIRDTAYTDAASFKASLSGVYMVYEKATASTETAEPYNPNQICDPNGTEEYVSTTVAPVGHTTKYPLDVAGRLDNILSMPTVDGTYTLKATVADGKVTYSWVSE